MQQLRLAAMLAAVVSLCACSASPSAPAAVSLADDGGASPSLGSPPAVLVGSGDIGLCGSVGHELTASLLDRIAGTVFAAGDVAYPHGRTDDFRNCYDPSWGRHRDRTRPAPGNHEYDTGTAAAYFEYFGPNAGPPGRGYYSYTLGAWHVLSLNSEVDVRAGSRQEQWLRAELAANRSLCTVAYWHKPRFSSGSHGDNPKMADLWRTLHEFRVEIVISGHDHNYERFSRQDADGRADQTGIRQFVVGTGGTTIRPPRNIRPNSVVIGQEWGVLALTLEATSYRWEFVPVDGGSFRDSGTTSCY